jgi:hypothetical protein
LRGRLLLLLLLLLLSLLLLSLLLLSLLLLSLLLLLLYCCRCQLCVQWLCLLQQVLSNDCKQRPTAVPQQGIGLCQLADISNAPQAQLGGSVQERHL